METSFLFQIYYPIVFFGLLLFIHNIISINNIGFPSVKLLNKIVIILLVILIIIKVTFTNFFFVTKNFFFGILVLSLCVVLELFNLFKRVPNLNLPSISRWELKNKGILIGYGFFGKKKKIKKLKLSFDDLERHLLIYGQTGSGKTYFLKNLLYNLNKIDDKIPFTIFEFKEEYREIERYIENFEIIKPGSNFQFCLFDSDIFSNDLFVEVIFDSLKSCNIIKEDSGEFSPQMEKVLVDCISEICTKFSKKSWGELFNLMDNYLIKNKNQIPQLEQTLISIKNRLRRYHSGPLKSLFCTSNDPKCRKISELISNKSVIELGNILRLGGSKEDVLFFANLVLKWIWEKNIQKKTSNTIKHITIFEDCSYIASKKLLESSKLSTYLEDIALLLRGKGECLISLTTTIDISQNIVQNSGNKFFFKFNEKIENVIHHLGIEERKKLNIKDLKTGYCIVKMDSVHEPILLKVRPLKKKKMKNKRRNNRKIEHIIDRKKIDNEIQIHLFLAKKEFINDNFCACIQNIRNMYILLKKKYSNDLEIQKIFDDNKIKTELKMIENEKSLSKIDESDIQYLLNLFSSFINKIKY